MAGCVAQRGALVRGGDGWPVLEVTKLSRRTVGICQLTVKRSARVAAVFERRCIMRQPGMERTLDRLPRAPNGVRLHRTQMRKHAAFMQVLQYSADVEIVAKPITKTTAGSSPAVVFAFQ